MNFYTSVNRYGNNILYSGFENGQRIDKKIPYMPTLFTNSDKETGWNNLQNQPVVPKTFDTMREASDFVKRFENVDNYPVYGTTFGMDSYPRRPLHFKMNLLAFGSHVEPSVHLDVAEAESK